MSNTLRKITCKNIYELENWLFGNSFFYIKHIFQNYMIRVENLNLLGQPTCRTPTF